MQPRIALHCSAVLAAYGDSIGSGTLQLGADVHHVVPAPHSGGRVLPDDVLRTGFQR